METIKFPLILNCVENFKKECKYQNIYDTMKILEIIVREFCIIYYNKWR